MKYAYRYVDSSINGSSSASSSSFGKKALTCSWREKGYFLKREKGFLFEI